MTINELAKIVGYLGIKEADHIIDKVDNLQHNVNVLKNFNDFKQEVNKWLDSHEAILKEHFAIFKQNNLK